MPNIIEQQDLLKGLPDTRLAMLLQNPMGDIPPFLVAAEAQRRQAIRQQFAGSEGEESVVDTLTKQLANVPQNIPAPTRSPPMVPQTPQMQGVAALQAQQAVQQMAQPQEMRAGGMVQRYQSQGLVERMGSQYGSRYPTMQELARMTPEELAALRKFQSDQNMQRLNQRAQITGGKFGQGLAYQRELLENRLEGPFSGLASPESTIEAAKRLQDIPTEEEMTQTLEANRPLPSTARPRTFPTLPPGASGGMSLTTPPKAAAAPVETPPPEPGETQDEYRARLEKLLAAQQPSDWEKAQGYFAMAEQFLDPSKTTMQSLVGAGQAFAQSAGEQARAQREADLARERGLLEYDIGERDRKAAIEAERAKREYESLLRREERGVLGAKEAMSYYGTEIKALYDQIKEVDERVDLSPEEKKLEKDSIKAQIDGYRMQASFLMRGSGYNTGNAITLDQLRALAGQQ
jgi:hypothetical protein